MSVRKAHEQHRRVKRKVAGSPTRNMAGLPIKQRARKLATTNELREELMTFVRNTDPKPDDYYDDALTKYRTPAKSREERERAQAREDAQEITRLRQRVVELLNLDLEMLARLRKIQHQTREELRKLAERHPKREILTEHLADITKLLTAGEWQVNSQHAHFDYDEAVATLVRHRFYLA